VFKKASWFVSLTVAIIIATFIFGLEAREKGWIVAALWSETKSSLLALSGRSHPPNFQSDTEGRLATTCPRAGPGTMVALVLGQSHSANYLGERFRSKGHVYNEFKGTCFLARDPLLGADSNRGNIWTLIANELLRARVYQDVVLVVRAIGDTTIGQWAPGGTLYADVKESIVSLPKSLRFTHVFVQQGEADVKRKTSYSSYLKHFQQLIEAIRNEGIDAPIFIARESSTCDLEKSDNSNVDRAQVDLIDAQSRIKQGPVLAEEGMQFEDLYDGCHFSGLGARKLADAWLRIISASDLESLLDDRVPNDGVPPPR
jgi:lysophospholipase L1-like esterase